MVRDTDLIITAGCYLVRNRGEGWQIFLMERAFFDGTTGWTPPKGKIDPGEGLEHAAIRETQEETGYQNFQINRKLDSYNISYVTHGTRKDKQMNWFLAELIDDENTDLKLTEGEKKNFIRLEWVDFEKAVELLKWGDEKRVMEKVIEALNGQPRKVTA
ncbi:MAG: NUDIX domain-containing protein [Candidatus Dojkabacteria bacterium]